MAATISKEAIQQAKQVDINRLANSSDSWKKFDEKK